jgi:endonuclease YncB( thermonuclease family)
MGTLHQFRHLRWGPPPKLPAPRFLGAQPPHGGGGMHRYAGFIALAALVAAAVVLLDLWQSGRAPDTTANTRSPATVNAVSVTVIDGDSLRAGNEDIRLDGIDAPELRQSCRDERGGEWACGLAAKQRLAALVSRGDVACGSRGRDRYNRTLGLCSAGPVADLGEALVREGYAVDYMGGRYSSAEREAREARRGLWRGDFERPEDWRRKHPRRAAR